MPYLERKTLLPRLHPSKSKIFNLLFGIEPTEGHFIPAPFLDHLPRHLECAVSDSEPSKGESIGPAHGYKLSFSSAQNSLLKDKMIVKLEGKLERGFAPWKAMLEGASDKLKEHGMTVIYAGTSVAEDNSLTVIIDLLHRKE